MTPIDEIKCHLSRYGADIPRVLLIVGGRFKNAVGDTVHFAYHVRYLTAALGDVRVTVWTSDEAVWTALCDARVTCVPFVTEQDGVYNHDLVVFDCVTVDEAVEKLFSKGKAALLDISPHGGWVRYRLEDPEWTVRLLPPKLNNLYRLQQAYECLGLTSAQILCAGTNSGATVRRQVYLNPYGSQADKCLDKELLRSLIEVMGTQFGGASVVSPSMPKAPPGQERRFEELDDVVSQAASRGTLRRLNSMSASEYIQHVRASAVVVGSDTSTQHVANYYAIPSIAIYPSSSGYRYYFWGCFGPGNICLAGPPMDDLEAKRHLADLTGYLAHRLTNRDAADHPGEMWPMEYIHASRAMASGAITLEQGKQAIQSSLALIREIIPERWQAFVIPELQVLAQEIIARASQRIGNQPDELSHERLKHVFALRTARLIADGFDRKTEDLARKEELEISGGSVMSEAVSASSKPERQCCD